MAGKTRPLHVSLVAIPDAVISTLTGIYDVLGSFRMLGRAEPSIPAEPPFTIEIVSTRRGNVALASGVPVEARRAVVGNRRDGHRHRAIGAARRRRLEDRPLSRARCVGASHARAGCAAVLGLLRRVPACRDRPVRRPEHDGPLGLCRRVREDLPECAPAAGARAGGLRRARGARHLGRVDDLARSRALSHRPPRRRDGGADRGALLRAAMASRRARALHRLPRPAGSRRRCHRGRADLAVDALLRRRVRSRRWCARSGLAERTFKRRFTEATGFAPIDYVQRLRIEDAKRRLERTDAPADEISWQVGYEDAAFFRRLFKRTTGMTPGAYRRRFQVPAFARPQGR